jgi:hypothetical protein
MSERDEERDAVAEAARSLENAEPADDDARLEALERAHAALQEELDRPTAEPAGD